MIKACLFDLDGTLINSEEYYVKGMTFLANSLGANIKEDVLFKAIGTTMDETYKIFEEIVKKPKNEWIDMYNNYFSNVNPINFKELLFQDVKETFIELNSKGIKVAICSMSPQDYIKKFVDECELNEYVDYYISGENCKNNKPSPDIYLNALKSLNINSDEAIAVEDASQGIESAVRANIKVVARDNSKFNIDQSKASLVFKDLRKLIKII